MQWYRLVPSLFTDPLTLAGIIIAVTSVLLLLSKRAFSLPIITSATPPSPVPFNVIIVPTGPLAGLKDVITSALMLNVRTSP
jgi:hypothetical protein